MPIYEFKCAKCGSVFEELILSAKKYADELNCPSCGSPDTEKLISAAAVPASGFTASSYSPPNCEAGFS